jgi:hypothetical protein
MKTYIVTMSPKREKDGLCSVVMIVRAKSLAQATSKIRKDPEYFYTPQASKLEFEKRYFI